mmetsp:Transcript_12704/g.37743  ORF Transcript_12704/g.37743 Transcript_12704/m.37743 type:complete len:412 (+) Transcript_12704:262-1497(+)
MSKSVASQTLAETLREVLPVLSFFFGSGCLARPPVGCSGRWPNESLGDVAKKSRQSRWSPAAGCDSGHRVSTSEAFDIVSSSMETRIALSLSASDQPLVFDICLDAEAPSPAPSNDARISGRHASGGRGQPKYSWKVEVRPRSPFLRTTTPSVPFTSKRCVRQPLNSQGPAELPSQDVASATSSSLSFMSHCTASADTRSSTTASASSPSSPSVTSTTVCLEWLIMQKLGRAPPLPLRKSVVSSLRLLRRKRFHEASVESTRSEFPRLRRCTTSEGASLCSKGTTGDSNSHLMLHSKSGSIPRDMATESRRFAQRRSRLRCVPWKSVCTSFWSPRLTATSSGDQPNDVRSRGSAPRSSSCCTICVYSRGARGSSSTASISGVALRSSASSMSATAERSPAIAAASASQTAS